MDADQTLDRARKLYTKENCTEQEQQEAINLLKQLADQDNLEALVMLGGSYVIGDRVDEDPAMAEQLLRRAIVQKFPNPQARAVALNYLGCALHNRGKLEEALKEFQTAVDLDPEHRAAQLSCRVHGV